MVCQPFYVFCYPVCENFVKKFGSYVHKYVGLQFSLLVTVPGFWNEADSGLIK